MSEIPFLQDLVVISAAGVLSAILVSRLRLPVVVGLMLGGALISPNAFKLVQDKHTIDVLAEIGVILLLFTIGLEFSMKRMKRIGKLAVIGGSLQVGLTILATVAVMRWLGFSTTKGVFFGFLMALSSTAIVLKGLADRGETDAPHGRLIIGTLIFQDLCVVPMMLVVPALAGQGGDVSPIEIAKAIAKAVALVGFALALGKWVIPKIFSTVDALRSREAFLLATIAVCMGIAGLTAKAGLSLALGAFLAGMILADSEYSHQAMTVMMSLRDMLTGLFFMSLGMMFDTNVVLAHPLPVLAVFAALWFGKGFIATLSVLAMRFPARVAIVAGVGLAQFGEFGFVLAGVGYGFGLIGAEEKNIFLSAGVLTMFLTPLSMRMSPTFAAGARLLKPLDKLLGATSLEEAPAEIGPLKNHTVIAGFGVAGRLVADALKAAGHKYVIVDLNSETVRNIREEGQSAYYGDITSDEVLGLAHLEQASALVIVISDPDATERTIAAASRVAPDVPIIARLRYLDDHGKAIKLGASDVVSEELEASIEIVTRASRLAGTPVNVLDEFIRDTRKKTLSSFRKRTYPRMQLGEYEDLADLRIEKYLVRDGSFSANRSLAAIKLRSMSGVTAIAIKRGERLTENPDPTLELLAGDVLFLVGQGAGLRKAMGLLDAGTPSEDTGA